MATASVTNTFVTATKIMAAAMNTNFADLVGFLNGSVMHKDLVTAKGDLLAATAGSTPARLAVGADGTLLLAASGEAAGVKWGGAWSTWTPTLANMTLGNGTIVARYAEVGKLVVGYFRFTLGTTSTMGTAPSFTVPVTMNANWTTGVPIGPAWMLDNGTAITYGQCRPTSTSAAIIYVSNSAGTYLLENNVTATAPFTWASTDQVTVPFFYEAA
jgi:hypothetical protein